MNGFHAAIALLLLGGCASASPTTVTEQREADIVAAGVDHWTSFPYGGEPPTIVCAPDHPCILALKPVSAPPPT
ncbi:MAG: hypothetical protein IPK66_17650 [Rhodospirillales bacterium]|nr:hypothetical protein [Rhodospirillales bacterium]